MGSLLVEAGEPATQCDQSPLTVPIMYLLQVTLLPGPDLDLAKELLEEGTVSGLWSRCVAGSPTSASVIEHNLKYNNYLTYLSSFCNHES